MLNVIKLIWPYLLAVFIGFTSGWWLTSNRMEVTIETLKSAQAEQMKAISDEAAKQADESAKKLTAAHSALSELDKKTTEELTNAKAENDNLRSAVAAGTKRVRLAAGAIATCSNAVSSLSSASGVGNAPSVELTGDFGQRILDIRAGIINDRAKIEYLQGFIEKLQQLGVVSK